MSDRLAELSVLQAGLELGWIMRGELPTTISTANRELKPIKMPAWSQEENEFLRTHMAIMTDAEIGKALGRSKIAVHLHYERDLHLPSRSKAPDVITSHLAAKLLGLDGHTVTCWCDRGLIPAYIMPGGRNIRLIKRIDLEHWVLNPENWIYLHAERIRDVQLRRLLAKRAERWGDEWWTTGQVAKYHHVDVKDVTRYIKAGRIKGRKIEESKGGRASNRHWAYWYILRSEATRPDLHFYRRGEPYSHTGFTRAGDAWILRAHDELGLTFRVIAMTMKRNEETVRYRFLYLKKMSKAE